MARMKAGGFEPAPVGTITAPQEAFSGPVPTVQPLQQLDPLDIMPPAAQEKLQVLRQRNDDAHHLIPEFSELQDCNVAKAEAVARLKQLQAHPAEHGFNLAPDDPRVQAAIKAVKKATADAERMEKLREMRTSAWQSVAGALRNVEAYLQAGKPHGTMLQDYEGEPPKLQKGENGLLDAIEKRRRRVRELRADLNRIESAPYPSSHVKRRLREQVDALAQRGMPDVSLVVEHDGNIAWPQQSVRATVFNAERAISFAEVPDTIGLFAFVHRDALLAALDAMVDQEKDDAAALTTEARQVATAEVQGDLLAVERDESALVWMAQAQNLPVEHRADCAPQAILGCRLVTPPRVTNGHTSPEHGWTEVTGYS